MTEQWRRVPGRETAYEVSDHGRVRSIDRFVKNGVGIRVSRGQVLKQQPIGAHPSVWLANGRNGKRVLVHRLVLMAFVGPPPEGMEGCHFDDVPTNNTLSNLRWDTKGNNQLDRVRNGHHFLANRTQCDKGHHFTPENTGRRKGRNGRFCRTCARTRTREYMRTVRAIRRAAA